MRIFASHIYIIMGNCTLSAVLRHLGMSSSQFAREIGWSRQRLHPYISGKRLVIGSPLEVEIVRRFGIEFRLYETFIAHSEGSAFFLNREMTALSISRDNVRAGAASLLSLPCESSDFREIERRYEMACTTILAIVSHIEYYSGLSPSVEVFDSEEYGICEADFLWGGENETSDLPF